MGNGMQTDLFGEPITSSPSTIGKAREPFGRLDSNPDVHSRLSECCRLRPGEIWEDPNRGHRVGVLDATDADHLARLTGDSRPSLFVNDPPYNVPVGNANTRNLFKRGLPAYMRFSRQWVENCATLMNNDAHFYVWLGADVRDGFQPLPDFMIMMREMRQFSPRNFITLRNQRGYGTQKNWMWVRQELLHYVHGSPHFTVTYTDIPKILRGYYNLQGSAKTTATSVPAPSQPISGGALSEHLCSEGLPRFRAVELPESK